MVWPEPQPFRFPHQTTYGTDDMTCKDNPRQPDVVAYRALRDERDRLEADNTALRAENTALIDAVNGHLDTIHKDAEELAEATRALGEKEMELREARGAAVAANREAQRLRDVNTELQRQIANATPLGTYLIRSPGVYVATEEGSDHHLMIVKHLHRDAVVLTAHPDAEPAQWWQLYRDGLTGNLAAWHPPMGLHELIAATAKVYQDPSARPWIGIDPGKPGDDMTTVSWRYPAGDPSVRVEDTVKEAAERIDRLEDQAEMADRNQQLMAPRLSRLEAWARQFDNQRFELGGGRAGVFAVKPLDSMETKA